MNDALTPDAVAALVDCNVPSPTLYGDAVSLNNAYVLLPVPPVDETVIDDDV